MGGIISDLWYDSDEDTSDESDHYVCGTNTCSAIFSLGKAQNSF